MRAECTAALRTQRMPTTRNEEYRFTDITPLLQLEPRVLSSCACSLRTASPPLRQRATAAASHSTFQKRHQHMCFRGHMCLFK